ncbi:MAG: RNA polymerase sigma factor, partial [Lewinella sp.]|nr:RNA polymerase sigma factor [Lewinella sp.]
MFLRSLFGQDLSGLSDEELLAAARGRRRERFCDEIFRRYHVEVYGLCLYLLREASLSQDLTLQIFAKAFTELSGAEVSQLRPWLLALTRNTCLNHLKQAKKRQQARQDWQARTGEQNMLYAENRALETFSLLQEPGDDDRLHALLATLPAEQRRCLELFYWEGLSYREIAARTGFAEKQVKSYLQNGKRQLRQRWEASPPHKPNR